MRRKDRAMDRDFGLDLIDRAAYGVLALIDGEGTYPVPLSLAREGEDLYFHSAREGRKVGLLKDGSLVNLVFVGQVQVPENFSPSELEGLAKDPAGARTLISSVFTTEFESVMVRGRLEVLEEEEDQVHGLELICKKYTPDKMAYFDLAIQAGLARVRVYRIRIEDLTAKRKKYDQRGREMKWGRME